MTHLEDDNARIIITTIQKLATFIKKNAGHSVFDKRVVIIFDAFFITASVCSSDIYIATANPPHTFEASSGSDSSSEYIVRTSPAALSRAKPVSRKCS